MDEFGDKQVAAQPQHTYGRKRKRIPTFTIGDEESTTEESEGSSKYSKGILLAIPENNADSRCELNKVLVEQQFSITAELECMRGTWSSCGNQWLCQQQYSNDTLQSLYVTAAAGKGDNKAGAADSNYSNCSMHPAYMYSCGNLVFHSLEEVQSSLKSCPDKPGIQKLKQFAEEIDIDQEHEVKNPFIVIEGLDGTGKSTLVASLVEKLAARQLQTPPPRLHSLRSTFDSYPALIRRLYYSLGNYLVTADIRDACEHSPVVMDRYWHSTAAYTIATECGGPAASSAACDHLPPPGHSVYDWPDDLLRPTAVVMLTVSEDVRSSRMGGRAESTGAKLTPEEIQLEKDNAFRARITECYRRMVNPKIIEVNADGDKDQVLQTVLNALQQNDISIPST